MTRPVLLNLGCGTRASPEWINIDYSFFAYGARVPVLRSFFNPLPPGYLNRDLRKGIPFAPNTADVVYSSHVLEHVDHDAVPAFLGDIYRVLKRGALLRVVVPDLESAARSYLRALDRVRLGGPSPDDRERYELSTLLLFDQMVRKVTGGELARWLRAHSGSVAIKERGGILESIAQSAPRLNGLPKPLQRLVALTRVLDPSRRGEMHRWMYDEFSLSSELERAGFRSIKRMSADTSRYEGWEKFCLDTDPDGAVHQPESIWMEAVK